MLNSCATVGPRAAPAASHGWHSSEMSRQRWRSPRATLSRPFSIAAAARPFAGAPAALVGAWTNAGRERWQLPIRAGMLNNGVIF